MHSWVKRAWSYLTTSSVKSGPSAKTHKLMYAKLLGKTQHIDAAAILDPLAKRRKPAPWRMANARVGELVIFQDDVLKKGGSAQRPYMIARVNDWDVKTGEVKIQISKEKKDIRKVSGEKLFRPPAPDAKEHMRYAVLINYDNYEGSRRSVFCLIAKVDASGKMNMDFTSTVHQLKSTKTFDADRQSYIWMESNDKTLDQSTALKFRVQFPVSMHVQFPESNAGVIFFPFFFH